MLFRPLHLNVYKKNFKWLLMTDSKESTNIFEINEFKQMNETHEMNP